MGYKGTNDINDYLDDYEQSAQDYAEMGPMWAELVFPDDFDALRALCGGRNDNDDNRNNSNDDRDNSRNRR